MRYRILKLYKLQNHFIFVLFFFSFLLLTAIKVYSQTALKFNVADQYVTFGTASVLGASTFTLECWIYKTGTGGTANTGIGGINAIPIITKGRGEDDTPANLNMNYFLGINSSGKLAADFEDKKDGSNHPITGTTTLSNNVWYHIAATYDGTTWRIYLNGKLDAAVLVGAFLPENTSIQHAGIATAMNSSGTATGYFQGVIDEVRIWNYARNPSDILNNMNVELTSGTGLIGRWGFNEGSGTTAINSIVYSTPLNGTLVKFPSWVAGNPGLSTNSVAITLGSPSNGGVINSAPTLTVAVNDNTSTNLVVKFMGRIAEASPAFKIIGLPDTQNYSAGLNGGSTAIFSSQTQWVSDNAVSQNIRYVAHLGDIVEKGYVEQEWINANISLSILEKPITGYPEGIPFGIAVGNHDMDGGEFQNPPATYNNYNKYFGASRFEGRSYYGGHYGTDNANHYDFFSSSGLDFIVVYLQYYATQEQLIWANGIIASYPNKRAILVSHSILNNDNSSNFTTQGQAIFDAVQGNENLFLMLCGHLPVTGRRADKGTKGNTIYTLLSDYQTQTNGGNGYLRVMEFVPSSNQINITTYSPYTGLSFTDSGNKFTLPYNMSGTGSSSFTEIATVTVPNNSNATYTWNNLQNGKTYEWYVTVSDGNGKTTTSPIWSFKTDYPVNPPVQYSLNLLSNPSNGGSTSGSGTYNSGSNVTVTAMPATGYTFTGWSGDASGNTNPLTVAMTYNKNITANFAINTYILTITSVNGTVTKNPNQTNYSHGSTVQLTAAPGTGYTFTGWTGSVTGLTNPITVTMDGNKNITANFVISTPSIPNIKPTIATSTIPNGTDFWVEVKVGDPNTVSDLYGISFKLSSNNLNCTYVDESAENGGFIGIGSSILFFPKKVNNQTVDIGISKSSGSGVNGSGIIARVKFTSPPGMSGDQSVIFSLIDITAINSTGGTVLLSPSTLPITIKAGIIAVDVWPGDCNNDKTVNSSDIIPIGLFYGQSGAGSNNPGSSWQAYSRVLWTSDGSTPKRIYADANGDGTINSADIIPIGLNYIKTHASIQEDDNKTEIKLSKTNADATIKPIISSLVKNNTAFIVQVKIGDPNQIQNLYGISFKLQSDKSTCSYVDGSAENGGFLGTGSSLLFFPQKVNNQTVDIGISKISGPGVSGSGIIAQAQFISSIDQIVTFSLADVTAIDNNGNALLLNIIPSGVTVDVYGKDNIPTEFSLAQNYPNPFNPTTTIEFRIPITGYYVVKVFNAIGQTVRLLAEKEFSAGIYKVNFDGNDLSSGIYFYQLFGNSVNLIRKMMLIK
ncbi:MAG: LamG-like jellyroll fold domain-containing protein [Melioribacteraceae bacterium]